MQFTTSDISKILDVPLKTIYRLIEQESIPILKVLDQVYFEPQDFLEWCITKNMPIKYNVLQNYFFAGKTNYSLSKAMAAGKLVQVEDNLKIDQIIEKIVNQLPVKQDKELLLKIQINKHKIKPLFIYKNEVAVPYIRTPIITSIENPKVWLFYLTDYINVGLKFVHAWFWILSPTVNAHTQLVEKLYRALLRPSFFESVTGHAPWENIIIEAGKCEQDFKMAYIVDTEAEEVL
jgi:hypothetical protein